MKAVIVQFPFGVVAFDEENKVLDQKVYPKKPQAAAKIASKNQPDQLFDDMVTLLTQLQGKGYDNFVFENPNVAKQAQEKLNVAVAVAEPINIDAIRFRMEEIAVETGFVKDGKDLSLWMHNVSMEMAKIQVKGATEKRDLVVGQAIQTLDDLDRTVNLFMGRLREWYGVHFPELDRLVEKHETYARLVLDLGEKDNFTAEALEKEDLPKSKTELVSKIAASSMGADVSEPDLIQIQALSKNILETYKLRESMETYLNQTMQEVAPNTKAIAGALLGARLIAISGGLENLAKRPASTMQVLGAEKALFRSIKTGARPPKHGLIFQHTLLHDAKKWQRGKIARAIAGKLAIAIRADAFGTGRYIGDKLKADLNRRIAEIEQKYPDPPPLKEQSRDDRPRESRERRDFGRGGGGGGGGFRDRRGGGSGGGYGDRRGGSGGYGGERRGGYSGGGGGYRDRSSGSGGYGSGGSSAGYSSGTSDTSSTRTENSGSGGSERDNAGFRDRGSSERPSGGYRDRNNSGSGGSSLDFSVLRREGSTRGSSSPTSNSPSSSTESGGSGGYRDRSSTESGGSSERPSGGYRDRGSGGSSSSERPSGGYRDRGSGGSSSSERPSGGYRDRGSGGSSSSERPSGGYRDRSSSSPSSGSESGGSGGYFKNRSSGGSSSSERPSGGYRDRSSTESGGSSERPSGGFRDRGSSGSGFSYRDRGSGGSGAGSSGHSGPSSGGYRDRSSSGGSGGSGGDRRDRPSEQKWRQNRRADKS